MEFVNDWVKVCDVKDFDSKVVSSKSKMNAVRLPVHGRDVMILKRGEHQFHCFDAVCYHFGGPLILGM